VLNGAVTLKPDLNFVANYVKYEVTNQDKNKTFTTGEMDPEGTYTWSPMVEDNGNVAFRVIAYDHAGQAYASRPVSAVVSLEKKLALRGVTEGAVVEKPVTLSVSRNFQVSETEYVMRDPQTGKEEVLAKVGYVSHRWFPGTDLSGTKELFVRVKDTSGVTHTSDSITVKLTGAPKLLLEGVGPQQVVTGPLQLKVTSNTPLQGVQFVLINPQTGARKGCSRRAGRRSHLHLGTGRGRRGPVEDAGGRHAPLGSQDNQRSGTLQGIPWDFIFRKAGGGKG
jgi:hypothetical protein